ncbi:MAG: GTPase Era [Actinomycetota bacterium]|jgi:GTP-binding protein Era|nr:GTPase Era [Actinomycetota bacterium]
MSPGTEVAEVPLRSGFVAVVGRPNVGKSTLVNAMVGSKVSIMSPRPNTTRRALRGVLNRPGLQAVLVDTPGLHKPRSALGRRMNEHVASAICDVDMVIALVDASAGIGRGDRLVIERCVEGATSTPGMRVVVLANKVDRAARAAVAGALVELQSIVELEARACAERLGDGYQAVEGRRVAAAASVAERTEYFPVSALTGAGVEAVVEIVAASLPEGPAYFPAGMVSDAPEHFVVAELVREQLLAHTREEIPHSVACRVTEWEWPRVRVEILVERDSQKAIVIGREGRVLRAVGEAARAQIGDGVYLDLHVVVVKHWQDRPDLIERLGY